MNIIDLYGNQVDIEHIEKVEQDLANQSILENDVVLELGARYGSVSCIINSSIEPVNSVASTMRRFSLLSVKYV